MRIQCSIYGIPIHLKFYHGIVHLFQHINLNSADVKCKHDPNGTLTMENDIKTTFQGSRGMLVLFSAQKSPSSVQESIICCRQLCLWLQKEDALPSSPSIYAQIPKGLSRRCRFSYNKGPAKQRSRLKFPTALPLSASTNQQRTPMAGQLQHSTYYFLQFQFNLRLLLVIAATVTLIQLGCKDPFSHVMNQP